jgi:tripartite ATP-independent transporter DctP family solute receptor
MKILLAAAALLCAAAPALADDKVYEVKFGTAAPEDTPWSKQLSKIKKRIEADSKGRIKYKLFLGSVKGGEDSMARQVAQGSLQAAGLSTGALAVLVKELEVLELPYLFKNAAEADKVLDDPEVWGMIEKLLAKKGLQAYLWSENGFRNFATKDRPVKTPADLKGAKMRSQEQKVHVEMYKSLGASPVPIAVPEVLSALQTGIVDGFDNTPLFAFATSWYQGAKHWVVSDHIYQPALVVYNKAWFDTVPPDLQQMLVGSRPEETNYGRQLIRKLNDPLLKNLGEAGITVTRLSDAEKAAFAKATEPVYKKIRDGQSAEGKALYDLIMKKLGRK